MYIYIDEKHLLTCFSYAPSLQLLDDGTKLVLFSNVALFVNIYIFSYECVMFKRFIKNQCLIKFS